MITDDLYDFMCLGQEMIHSFVGAHPDDYDGHYAIQHYVALATSLAHQALQPATDAAFIVKEFNERFTKENPDLQRVVRH